jgi:fructose-bisphosphate aldolase class II
MKLAVAALLAVQAAAFAPAPQFGAPRTAMHMSTETETEEKAFAKLPASVKPGVVTGKALFDFFDNVKE